MKAAVQKSGLGMLIASEGGLGLVGLMNVAETDHRLPAGPRTMLAKRHRSSKERNVSVR